MNPPVTNDQQEYIEYNDVNITNMKWMCKIKLENDNDDEQKIDSTNLNKPVTMIIKPKDETNEQQEYIEYNDDDDDDEMKIDSTDLNKPVTMIIKQKDETNKQQEYIEYNDDDDDEMKIDSTDLNKPVTNEQQEYIEYNDVDVASMKWMCKIKLEDDKNDDKKNDSTDLNNLNNRKRSLLLPITCDLCRWPEHFTGKDVTPNAWKHLITYHMQTSHIWEWYTDMKMKEYNLI